jgi:hypothetical protein
LWRGRGRGPGGGLNICGFCGGDVCSIELIASSKKVQQSFCFVITAENQLAQRKIHVPIM